MGPPLGSRNGAKPRLFEKHLEAVINNDNGTKLRKIVIATLDAAVAGEPWAVQFIAERLDGKAKAFVEHSNDPENPLIPTKSLIDALAAKAELGSGVLALGATYEGTALVGVPERDPQPVETR
jgi:hypothetical protein